MTTLSTRTDPTDDQARWHRLSPRMLLVHPITELVRALPGIVGIVLFGGANGHGLLTASVAVVLVGALSVSRWFTTRLRITGEQVELREGLLRRRTIATRRDRIRTVDVTAHLLHRLLGLGRVVIGTGLSDRKGGGRIVLDGLPHTAATALRDSLLHRGDRAARPVDETQRPIDDAQRPAADVLEEPAAGRLHELARLDPRWIGYAPFTLSGVVTGLLIWGFVWRVQGESGVDVLRSGPLRAVVHLLERMPTAVAVTVVTVAVVTFVAVTSTVGYVLAFWRFRLGRHDGGTLQVTRGLFTTRATSIERARLVGAEISETLLLRSVGGARALAVATGLRVGRGAERGGEVLLPPAPLAQVRRVAALVLDDSPAATVPLRAHGPRARRRRLTRAVLGAVVLLALTLLGYLTGGSPWPVGLAVLLLVASVPLGLDRYAGLGHAHEAGYLVTRYGSIVRRRTMLADRSVIGWTVRRSWFQRRAGLATLIATTAAGRQSYPITDVGVAEAAALARAVTPELWDQFRPHRPARPGPPATARSADRPRPSGTSAAARPAPPR